MAARKNIYGNAFDRVKAIRETLMTPRFRQRGACVGQNPKLWDDDDRELAFQAKPLCASCPALAECLAWGMEFEADGIWGGRTAAERRAQRRAEGMAFIPIADRLADVQWMEDVMTMSAADLAEKYAVSDRQGFRWKALVA